MNHSTGDAATVAPPVVRPGLAGMVGWLLLVVLLLALSSPANAREQQTAPLPPRDEATIFFNRLSLKDGLSYAAVRSLLQDKHGFLWVGTTAGLNRYDGYSFTIYSSERETPTDLHTAGFMTMVQSPDGLLWLGGLDDGLATYDPRTERFAHYRHDPGDPSSLGNNQIRSLSFDGKGALWIGTFGGGLDWYDPRSGIFTHFRHDATDPHSLSDDRVLALSQNQDGTLWVATFGGLDRYDPRSGNFTHFRHDAADPNSLSDDRVQTVYEDRAGQVWVGTYGGGLNRFDPRSGTFTHFRHDATDPRSLSSDIVTALHEDKAGWLWVGTLGGGLNRFDPKTAMFMHWTSQPGDVRSLPNNNIYDLLEDRSGMLWIATDGGGIASVELYHRSFLLYTPTPSGLSFDVVRGLASDHDGIFWVSTTGGGLNRFDPRSGTFTHFRHDDADPHSLPDDLLWNVYVDRDNVVWVGTDKGLLSRLDHATGRFTSYRPAGPAGYPIHAIYQTRDGVLWLGSNGGGLSRFDRVTGRFTTYRSDLANPHSLSNNWVVRIYEDSEGTIWVGTFGGGLNRFDRATESFTAYRYDRNDPNSISGNVVTSIAEDESGTLWVATSSGLNRFEPASQGFRHVSQRDGLQSNLILNILEADGMLWLSSQRGLSRLDPSTLATRSFSFADGLPEGGFTIGSLTRSPSGLIAGGGYGGFVVFDPAALAEPTPGPSLALLGLRINNQPVAVGETSPLLQALDDTSQLLLPAGSRSFTVEVAALDYHAPMQQRYRHRLDGVDQQWREGGSERRFMTYTSLGPGTYVLRVAASNPGGNWTEPERRLAITILPFWWETLWFRSALIGLICLGVLGLVRLRVRRLEASHRRLEEAVATRTADLLEQTRLQEQATTEARRSRDGLQTLLAISNELVTVRPIDSLLSDILDLLPRIVDYDVASVSVLDGTMLMIRAFRTNLDYPNMRDRMVDIRRLPPLQELVATQQPILRDDVQLENGMMDYVEEEMERPVVSHAWIAVPLILNQRVIGVLSLTHRDVGHYDEADLKRVQAIGTQLALAIGNAMMFEREQEAVLVEERNRLTRELHDAVTQTLFAASLTADNLLILYRDAPPQARNGAEQLHLLTRTALAEMRSLMVELRPAALTEKPLSNLLALLCAAIHGQSGLPIVVEVQGQQKLQPDVQIALYRVAQEALNNVVRHANASEARVRLEYGEGVVNLEVADDGQGFELSEVAPDTFGLRSMRERAAQIGARLHIESRRGKGTLVAVEWREPPSASLAPIDAASAHERVWL